MLPEREGHCASGVLVDQPCNLCCGEPPTCPVAADGCLMDADPGGHVSLFDLGPVEVSGECFLKRVHGLAGYMRRDASSSTLCRHGYVM